LELRPILAFAEDVDCLHLLKLMAKELMLLKVILPKSHLDTFMVSGVKISSMPKNIVQELEGLQLQPRS
jgi:hypothetical protein